MELRSENQAAGVPALKRIQDACQRLATCSAVGVLGGIIGASTVPNGQPLSNVRKIRVGAKVQAANILKQTTPVYPPLAKQAGTVRFNGTVGKDGTIEALEWVSGHPLFIESAQSAVRRWVYKPTLLNGEPVLVLTTVSRFQRNKVVFEQLERQRGAIDANPLENVKFLIRWN